MSDNAYNLVHQLARKLKAVAAYKQVMKDAKKCGDKECSKIFKRIKEDDFRHVRMIKEHITSLVKKNKLH